jgi:carbon dioxide concentrating mechanism protein CcmN
MSVLSLPATGHTEVYVNGDVIIDKTAAIAPGVILQATANGRIVIKAGACIGMGTVLTANQGTIEVGEGAVLGAGVLIVGSGKVGDRACIGSASTLIATSVQEAELVAPGSLLGDTSRQESVSSSETQQPSGDPWEENNGSHVTPQPTWQRTSSPQESNGFNVNSPPASETSTGNGSHLTPNPNFFSQPAGETNTGNGSHPTSNPNSFSQPVGETNTGNGSHPTPEQNSSSNQQSPYNTAIYGQSHIERLMVTLFPHKEKFKKKD